MKEYELTYDWECLNKSCKQKGSVAEIFTSEQKILMFSFCSYCGSKIKIIDKELCVVR